MTRLAALSLLTLAACQESEFDQTGYFKDDARNRVFAIVAPPEADTDLVQDHVTGLMNTDRQFTIAYVFPSGTAAPADFLTLAPDYMTANNRMFDGDVAPWRWRYIHSPNGQTTLIDCNRIEDEGHCRK